jgi:DNA-binding transcriptional MerR regulator
MGGKAERWLGPGETARRLGVTTKALRVYEREGLVVPHRAESGWRLYGPAHLARLHQIIVLRDLRLPLESIRTLLGSQSRLREVLRLQRETLESQLAKTSRAIALITSAERRLDEGRDLSLDDLANLTKETVVQQRTATEEFRNRVQARVAELDPSGKASRAVEDMMQAARAAIDPADVADVKALLAEAARLRDIGDTRSEAAKAVARRLRSRTAHVTRPPSEQVGVIRGAVAEVLADAESRAEPAPFDAATLAFIMEVMKGMKESGELT